MRMPDSLVTMMLTHESRQPDRIAYRYLATGDCDGEIQELSYGRLGRRSRAIGAWLQEHGLAGSRALLLYPPGAEFICGYMGCLSAGVIAVPGVPAQGRRQNHRALTRMKRLIADADVKVILGGRQVVESLDGMAEDFPQLADITCVITEEIPDEAENSWQEKDIRPDSVAFLQYTSGSTSAPRGVAVTHGNLMDNQRVLTAGFGHSPDAIAECGGELFVSWLPVYHDMGLIAPVLNTLHLGGTSTLFSPLHFLQRPDRWLTAISRYRPHTSGAPNFAYELCLRHATPELMDRLDLGPWRVAFNGAEPVRAATLRRFCDTFAAAGFRREAFLPCYGLAEATLMVSGSSVGAPPTLVSRSDIGSLGSQPGTADAELVGCGRPGPGMTVLIVDAERLEECPEGEVGEIWVAGESVARGYWRNTLATREVFRASLKDGRGGFLRTGDLGFLRDGELFITGRIKDLMVIDGRNHYPRTWSCRPRCPTRAPARLHRRVLRRGRGLGEQPVVVAEAAPEAAPEFDKITALIRSTIGEAHGLSVRDVVLVSPGTIPKTSSGKIQRRASRTAYLEGTLSVVGSSIGSVVGSSNGSGG
ncbi:fatty acyl-AMP ligase [Streptomyces sp. FXJ1.4098]|nr:fatty acyl-AMP ligase [Streptomyces sp. FXJ1.4098]